MPLQRVSAIMYTTCTPKEGLNLLPPTYNSKERRIAYNVKQRVNVCPSHDIHHTHLHVRTITLPQPRHAGQSSGQISSLALLSDAEGTYTIVFCGAPHCGQNDDGAFQIPQLVHFTSELVDMCATYNK